MAMLFTADLHLFHEKILVHRPQFSDLEGMHRRIASQWWDAVDENDEVFVLGDLSMPGQRDLALELVGQLPGTKYLISGNHDRTSPVHSAHFRHHRNYLRAFEAVMDCAKVKLPPITKRGAGLEVVLNHYPYDGEHDDAEGNLLDERHVGLRLRDEGVPLVHGHVHNQWRLRYSKRRNTPMLNAGVDRWDFTPVHADRVHRELAQMIRVNEKAQAETGKDD